MRAAIAEGAGLRLCRPGVTGRLFRHDDCNSPLFMFETLSTEQLDQVCGGMNPQLMTAMKKAVSMGLNIHWTHTGPHYPNSRHWRGRAIDIGGPQKQLAAFFKWARATHPHELIYKNMFLKDGHRVHAIGGHDAHVHYSV